MLAAKVFQIMCAQAVLLRPHAEANKAGCSSGDGMFDHVSMLQRAPALTAKTVTTTTTTTTTVMNITCPEMSITLGMCVAVSDVTGPQSALFVPDTKQEAQRVSTLQRVIFEYYAKRGLAQHESELQIVLKVNNMVITESGMNALKQKLSARGNGLQIDAFVTLSFERGFSSDLVAWNRGLQLGAEQYSTLSTNMREAGISDKSQLKTADANAVTEGLAAESLNSVRSSIDRQITTTTTTPVDPFSEGDRKRMEELQNAQQAAEQKALQLRKELEDKAANINADRSKDADQRAAAMAAALAAFSAASADLDAEMRRGQQQLDELLNSRAGRLRERPDLKVEDLIAQLGLLRGVVVSPVRVHDTVTNVVAEFASSYRTNGLEQYQHAILTKSDELDYEVSFSFSEASAAASASKVMSSLGNSATSAFSLTMSAAGFASGGIGSGAIDTSHSFSNAERSQQNTERSFSQQISSFYKQRYLIAPLYGVQIDLDFLQPSMKLQQDLKVLKAVCPPPDKCEGLTLQGISLTCQRELTRVFNLYGTHICPDVTIGGYYSSTAEVHSVSEMSAVMMDNIAASAMSSATSVTANAGFIGPMLAGSISGGYAGVTGGDTANASREDTRSQTSQFTSQVSFASRGGQPGLGPDQWRQSLEQNRNWAVTDRNIDRCIPLWHWLVKDNAMWAELSNFANYTGFHGPGPSVSNTMAEDIHTLYCTMQRMYTYYVTTYLPYTKWVPKNVLDFTAISPYMVGNGGFRDGSAECAQVKGDFQQQSASCTPGARCLMQGMDVPVAINSQQLFTSSVGCVFQPCCFPVEATLAYGEKGCRALAFGSSLSPDRLCKTGLCDNSNVPEGVCQCPPKSTFSAFTLTCVPSIQMFKASSCPDGLFLVAGGCKSETNGLGMPGHDHRSWECQLPSAEATVLCSTSEEIEVQRKASTTHFFRDVLYSEGKGEQIIGGSCSGPTSRISFQLLGSHQTAGQSWNCATDNHDHHISEIAVITTRSLSFSWARKEVMQNSARTAQANCDSGYIIIGGFCELTDALDGLEMLTQATIQQSQPVKYAGVNGWACGILHCPDCPGKLTAHAACMLAA